MAVVVSLVQRFFLGIKCTFECRILGVISYIELAMKIQVKLYKYSVSYQQILASYVEHIEIKMETFQYLIIIY